MRLYAREWSMLDLVAVGAERRREAWREFVRGRLSGPVLALLGFLPAAAIALLLSFGLDPRAWEPGQRLNFLAFGVSYAAAFALSRRFASLTSSGVVAMWSMLGAAVAVAVLVLVSRSYYSLSFLLSAFALGGGWLTLAEWMRSRVMVPTLAVIPGGHVEILEDLAGVNLVHLRRPALRWLRVDGLVADLHAGHGEGWSRFIVEQRLRSLPVYHCADVYERFAQKVSIAHLRDGDLERLVPPMWASVKPVGDLLLAAAGLLAAAPILLLAMVAIKLEDGGPILFRQERVGRWGRSFRIWKLRSMRTDAEDEGPRLATESDDRATRVGRFLRRWRIDELPQLVNVLRGEMSLIGPRPEQSVFVERFQQELPFYGARHLVKPGITGWAQVRAGYASDLPETQQKLVHDLYYVRHMSLVLDAYIVVRTVWIVATGFGAR